MARSKNCLKCQYCGRISGRQGLNWKNDCTCDYFLITGIVVKKGDKGDDPDHCLLFKQKTKPNRVYIKRSENEKELLCGRLHCSNGYSDTNYC